MHTYPNVIRVGVAGGTGYAGQELVALLARHPHVDLTHVMSSGPDSTARPMPRLARLWNGQIEPLNVDALRADCDVVFLAVPEAAAADLGAALVGAGVKVIDLSGAFRIKDDGARSRWYPATKALPAGVTYGLVEFYRSTLADARLISCPGCYPTAALLALLPLVKAGLLDARAGIVIDAKSGLSGAGRAATDRTHFSENHGSVSAYGIFSHRHTAELQQELDSDVTFVPHLVPLDRGILETIYVKATPQTTAESIANAFTAAYAQEPFVRVAGDALPEIKHVAHTNFCDIGWRFDPETQRLVLVSCLDNLVKGAAGQAVQNFNAAFGFDERTALV